MPPESEPAAAGQKGKEGASKDRKASAEPEKQKSSKPEAKETAPRAEPAPGEVNSLRDGDKPQKRLEKRRQPLGGFFKGLVGGRFASSFWAFGPGVWWVPPPKGTGWPGGGWALAKHRGPAVCRAQRARWAQASLFRGHRQV